MSICLDLNGLWDSSNCYPIQHTIFQLWSNNKEVSYLLCVMSIIWLGSETSYSHVNSGPPLAWVGRGSCRPSLCCRYWWTSPYCRGWSQSYLWRDILNRTVLCLFLQMRKAKIDVQIYWDAHLKQRFGKRLMAATVIFSFNNDEWKGFVTQQDLKKKNQELGERWDQAVYIM